MSGEDVADHPDLLFGALAIQASYLTREQLESVLEEQKSADGSAPPLGELCQKRGLLTSSQVLRVLEAQKLSQMEEEGKLFGVLAVRNGFVSLEDIDSALEYQKETDLSGAGSARLGQILLEMGKLSPQQVEALLEAQERLRRPSADESIDPDTETRELPVAEAPPPGTGGCAAWLVEVTADGLLRAHPLGEKTVIGRLPGHQVPVADMAASRNHARIDFSPYTCKHVLADLDSRNGTFVNGDKLSHPRALRPGDRVRVGATELRYAVGTGVDLSRTATDIVRAPASASEEEKTDRIERAVPAAIHLQRKILILAAAAGILATFLPWSGGSPGTRLGIQGPGWPTFLLFSVALALSLLPDRSRPLTRDSGLAAGGVGVLAVLFALWKLLRLPSGVSPGVGVFGALLPAVAVAAAALAEASVADTLFRLLKDLSGGRAREKAKASEERDRLLAEISDAALRARLGGADGEAVTRASSQLEEARKTGKSSAVKAAQARLQRARLKLGRKAIEGSLPLPDAEAAIARTRELDRVISGSTS